jgi:hypothetical protein
MTDNWKNTPGQLDFTLKREDDRLNRWVFKALVSAFVACALWAGCSNRGDEGDIRALIADGAALAEAHDIAGMLALASADVRAMPMDLDRRAIRGVLWRTFKYYGPLEILYPRPVVEIDDHVNEASAQLPFLIVKKDHPFKDLEGLRDDPMAWIDAIGDAADLYRLRLEWIKQDGDWRVDRAFLERFSGAGFGS